MHFLRAPFAVLGNRAGLFVVLAFLLAAQNTYASTLVASRFLAQVGAGGIPLYYILYAVVSIPFAAFFSNLIDRIPRQRLLLAALGLFTVLTLLLPVLPSFGNLRPYSAYLIVRVFEHLLYSLYYILVADYFSVLDNKRYAGRIALGMAVGGLAGGGLLTAASSAGGSLLAAFVTPLLVAAALGFAAWVTARHRPLEVTAPAARESIAETLRVLPQLLRRYPMAALMSAAMFVNVLLQCIAEFLAFSIYTANFPQIDQLAVFLGLVNAGLSILGFLVIALFTERWLPRLGVPVMNRVYPALDVVTFAALTIAPSLPTGILANVSYDPFEHGIDVPVTTMNYNAIRHRYVGRVRVFIDGMVFPLALACAGLLLLGVVGEVDLRLVAASGLVLSALLLGMHWKIGRHYALGLVEMLRDGAVELEEIQQGLRLGPEHAAEIHTMLASDPRSALVGLEIAARCAGDIAPAEIAAALAKIPPAQARSMIARFGEAEIPARRTVIEWLATDGPAGLRALAWEYLFNRGLPAEQAEALLADPEEEVRCVAAAAALLRNPAHKAAREVLSRPLPTPAALGVLAVLRHGTDPHLSDTIIAIGGHGDPAVRAAALETAMPYASACLAIRQWAAALSRDSQPMIRVRALALLAAAASEAELAPIAERFFADPAPEVRQAAAGALGGRGDAAVPAIGAHLRDDREAVQMVAFDALGAALGPDADDPLFDALSATAFADIPLNRRLARRYPAGAPGGAAIRAALDNARRRALRLVLHALDALGHHRTLTLVRTMIDSGDERTRANAIESLASVPQRRFVLPILPFLEEQGLPGSNDNGPDLDLLDEAVGASDPWLRAAVAVACHAVRGVVPEALMHDPAPAVAETIRQLRLRPGEPCPFSQEALMSRLAFLHGVRLFADTTLDDLIAVDGVLGAEHYLAGEVIMREGDPGDRLCILHAGRVVVKKGGHALAELGPGDFFGEMALFDNGPRSATVAAIGDVEVLALTRDRFHSLVHQRPGILMEMCTTLVRRLREAEREALGTPDHA